jgi:hypothetical protein
MSIENSLKLTVTGMSLEADHSSRSWVVNRVLTAEDYRSGQPRRNALVFIDVWRHDIYGIDEDGLFFCTDGSAGTMQFWELEMAIADTDKHGTLSTVDVTEAAAMVFHLTPPINYG